MDKHSSLDLLLETGLRHLYTAETEVFEVLLTVIEYAQSPDLKKLFSHHRDETHAQIERIKKIFSLLDIDIQSSKMQGMKNLTDQGKELLKTLMDLNFTDKSKGMQGILNEGKELIRHFNDTEANDFALITAAGKIENFEIACYNILSILMEKLGKEEIVKLLKTSLKEEQNMQQKLLDFAEKEIETLLASAADKS